MILKKTFLQFFIILFFFLNIGGKLYAQETENLSLQQIEKKADRLEDDGKHLEAIQLYQKIIKQENNNGSVYNKIGMCYFYLKDYEKAKDNFRLAVLYTQDDEVILSNLSAAYNYTDDGDKAFHYAMKAYEVKKTSQTLINVIATANNIDRQDEAIKIYESAPSEIKDHPRVWFVIARSNYEIGNYTEAVEIYTKAFENHEPSKNFPVKIQEEKYYYYYSITQLLKKDKNKNPKNFKYWNELLEALDMSLQKPEYKEEIQGRVLKMASAFIFVYPEIREDLRKSLNSIEFEGEEEFQQKEMALGNYDLLLDRYNNHIKINKDEISGKDLKKAQSYKYKTLVFQYAEMTINGEKSRTKLQPEMISLLKEIVGEEKITLKNSEDESKLRAAEATAILAVNLLYEHQLKSERSFLKQLFEAINFTDKNLTTDELMDYIEQKGNFN